ncbi:MAG: Crp/Fnr family transcriptional regulator [Thermodesulfobacteriota bacterium]
MTENRLCDLWYLSTTDIFSKLPAEEKEKMSSILRQVRIKKSGFVYTAGDRSNTIYILMKGGIKITRHTEDGKEHIIDILRAGDIFGELALGGEEERVTSAEALEDSLICAVDRDRFEALVSKSPSFSFSITKWIGLRLRRIENRYADMIFQDVRTRVLKVLRDLAGQYGTPVPKGEKIDIRLSHQELAGLVGASRETVTTELNNLKRAGEIIVEGRYFILPAVSAGAAGAGKGQETENSL